MTAFSIVPTPDHVTLAADSASQSVLFSVTNKTDRERRIRAITRTDTPAHTTWYTVRSPDTTYIRPNETTQFTVDLQPPTGAATDNAQFRLRVYDTDDPDDTYSDSQNIPVTGTTPPKKKRPFPWWILVAVTIVLVVIAVVAFLLTRNDNGDNGDPPPTPTPTPTETQSPSPTELPPISELQAVAGDGVVDLAWNPVDEATSYEVQVDGELERTDITETSTTVEGLTNGQEYQFTVRAISSDGRPLAEASVSEAPRSPPLERLSLTVTSGIPGFGQRFADVSTVGAQVLFDDFLVRTALLTEPLLAGGTRTVSVPLREPQPLDEITALNISLSDTGGRRLDPALGVRWNIQRIRLSDSSDSSRVLFDDRVDRFLDASRSSLYIVFRNSPEFIEICARANTQCLSAE